MSTKKPVILIADDDPEILTMLGIRLSKKGYQVLEAVDGNQTLNLARKHHPDLVLLDVMMPGKNGWEVAKELRADDEFSNVGIVMLTAIGEKVNEMTSPLYGADAYVDKPFDFSDLEQKIEGRLDAARTALVTAEQEQHHDSGAVDRHAPPADELQPAASRCAGARRPCRPSRSPLSPPPPPASPALIAAAAMPPPASPPPRAAVAAAGGRRVVADVVGADRLHVAAARRTGRSRPCRSTQRTASVLSVVQFHSG